MLFPIQPQLVCLCSSVPGSEGKSLSLDSLIGKQALVAFFYPKVAQHIDCMYNRSRQQYSPCKSAEYHCIQLTAYSHIIKYHMLQDACLIMLPTEMTAVSGIVSRNCSSCMQAYYQQQDSHLRSPCQASKINKKHFPSFRLVHLAAQ